MRIKQSEAGLTCNGQRATPGAYRCRMRAWRQSMVDAVQHSKAGDGGQRSRSAAGCARSVIDMAVGKEYLLRRPV